MVEALTGYVYLNCVFYVVHSRLGLTGGCVQFLYRHGRVGT